MRRYLGFIGVLTFIALASAALGQVTTTSSSGGTTFDGTSVTGQGPFLAPAGSATGPGFGWSADADGTGTGFFRSATDSINVTINGTSRWIFNANSHFTPVSSVALDFGAAALQLRDVYVGRSLQGSTTKALTESSATAYVALTIPNTGGCAGKVVYNILGADATNAALVSGELFFSAAATSGGVVTAATISDQHVLNPATSGTLTNTMTSTTGANTLTLLANAASSLTQTTLDIRYRVELTGGTCTVTAQ